MEQESIEKQMGGLQLTPSIINAIASRSRFEEAKASKAYRCTECGRLKAKGSFVLESRTAAGRIKRRLCSDQCRLALGERLPCILDVEDLTDMLNLAERTLYEWVSDNKIPYGKAGDRVLFVLDEILFWLKLQPEQQKEYCRAVRESVQRKIEAVTSALAA